MERELAAGYELLKSGKRFSNTMWEFSWLVQRSGKQAEYANWDKVLDEVVERGYDCLRIDAYPHSITAVDLPLNKAGREYAPAISHSRTSWGCGPIMKETHDKRA
jgi:Sugar-binding cellulase-like